MNYIKDITNQRFGKVIAIKAVGRKSKEKREQLWECSCDCGKTFTTSGTSLRSGRTKSCGCSKKDISFRLAISTANRINKEQAAINNLFSRYKDNAQNRGIDFNIDKTYFKELVTQNCYFCGSSPDKAINISLINEERIVFLNGIDRLDSNLGYEVANVVPCCKKCNYSKGTQTIAEFKQHILNLIPFATNLKR